MLLDGAKGWRRSRERIEIRRGRFSSVEKVFLDPLLLASKFPLFDLARSNVGSLGERNERKKDPVHWLIEKRRKRAGLEFLRTVTLYGRARSVRLYAI